MDDKNHSLDEGSRTTLLGLDGYSNIEPQLAALLARKIPPPTLKCREEGIIAPCDAYLSFLVLLRPLKTPTCAPFRFQDERSVAHGK